MVPYDFIPRNCRRTKVELWARIFHSGSIIRAGDKKAMHLIFSILFFFFLTTFPGVLFFFSLVLCLNDLLIHELSYGKCKSHMCRIMHGNIQVLKYMYSTIFLSHASIYTTLLIQCNKRTGKHKNSCNNISGTEMLNRHLVRLTSFLTPVSDLQSNLHEVTLASVCFD